MWVLFLTDQINIAAKVGDLEAKRRKQLGLSCARDIYIHVELERHQKIIILYVDTRVSVVGSVTILLYANQLIVLKW